MLIAAGTEDVQVRLCDIASGAFAHTLSGHRGMSILYYSFCLVYLFTHGLLAFRLEFIRRRFGCGLFGYR